MSFPPPLPHTPVRLAVVPTTSTTAGLGFPTGMQGMQMALPPPPPPTFIPVTSEPMADPFFLTGTSRRKARTVVIPPVSSVQAVKMTASQNAGASRRLKRHISPEPLVKHKRSKPTDLITTVSDESEGSDKESRLIIEVVGSDVDEDVDDASDKIDDPDKSDAEVDKAVAVDDNEEITVRPFSSNITLPCNAELRTLLLAGVFDRPLEGRSLSNLKRRIPKVENLASFALPARSTDTEKLLHVPKDKEKLNATLKPLKTSAELALESFKLEAAQWAQVTILVEAANSGDSAAVRKALTLLNDLSSNLLHYRRHLLADATTKLRTQYFEHFPRSSTLAKQFVEHTPIGFDLEAASLAGIDRSLDATLASMTQTFMLENFTTQPSQRLFRPSPHRGTGRGGASNFGRGHLDPILAKVAGPGAVFAAAADPVAVVEATIRVTNLPNPRHQNRGSNLSNGITSHGHCHGGPRSTSSVWVDRGGRDSAHLKGHHPSLSSSLGILEDLDGYLETLGQRTPSGRRLDLSSHQPIHTVGITDNMVASCTGVMALRKDLSDSISPVTLRLARTYISSPTSGDKGWVPSAALPCRMDSNGCRPSFPSRGAAFRMGSISPLTGPVFPSPLSHAGAGGTHPVGQDIRICLEGVFSGHNGSSPSTTSASPTPTSSAGMANPTRVHDRTEGQVVSNWGLSPTQQPNEVLPLQNEHVAGGPEFYGSSPIPLRSRRRRRIPTRSPTPRRVELVLVTGCGEDLAGHGDAIRISQRTPYLHHVNETTHEGTPLQRGFDNGLHRRHQIRGDNNARDGDRRLDTSPSSARLASEMDKGGNPSSPTTLLSAGKRASLPLRQTARVLGVANAAAIAIPALNAYLRPLQRAHNTALEFAMRTRGRSGLRQMWTRYFVSLSGPLRQNLLELTTFLQDWNGTSILPRPADITIFADASPNSGWGAILGIPCFAFFIAWANVGLHNSFSSHSIGNSRRDLRPLDLQQRPRGYRSRSLSGAPPTTGGRLFDKTCPPHVRQHPDGVVHQPVRRHSFGETLHRGRTSVLSLPGNAINLFGSTHCRGHERDGRQRLSGSSRSFGLGSSTTPFQRVRQTVGSSLGGSLCVGHECSLTKVLHLGSQGPLSPDGQRDAITMVSREPLDQSAVDNDPCHIDEALHEGASATLVTPHWPSQSWWPLLLRMTVDYPLLLYFHPDNWEVGEFDRLRLPHGSTVIWRLMWRIQGFTEVPLETKRLMQRRWSADTVKADACHWGNFVSWCGGRGLHPDTTTVSEWLTFFTHLFEEGRNGDYISKHRATLAKVFPLTRPAFSTIADYPEFKQLNLLLHLLDKQRTSDVTNVLLDGLSVLPDAVRYQLYRGKGWRPGHPDCRVRYVRRILDPPGLDIGPLFERILIRAAGWREPTSIPFSATGPNSHPFLLLHSRTHQGSLNANTLAKQTKEHMRRAGIPDPFTTHSITHAVATAQTIIGIPEGSVNSGRWRSMPVMRAHYIATTRNLWRPDNFVPLQLVTARPFGWQGDQPAPNIP
ncbi:hypothetical protein BC829DRAFT_421526 [Chytridium lagenaria]|nr:hypothetical protein BC829DRAFT_421526 [Chytridium lagenaria]